jgi:chromosome segregation ATPase
MALSSTEIKRLLQPMKDFAPAILRCVEIVEAAEQAERDIKDSGPAVIALKEEIQALQKTKQDEQSAIAVIRADVKQALEAAAQEKADIKQALKPLQEKLKAAQDALDSTQKEHAKILSANQQEVAGVEIVLAQKRQELADFRKSVPKTY